MSHDGAIAETETKFMLSYPKSNKYDSRRDITENCYEIRINF